TVSVDHFRGGVANEDDIDSGALGKLTAQGVVCGGHHDPLATALHFSEQSGGHALAICLHGPPRLLIRMSGKADLITSRSARPGANAWRRSDCGVSIAFSGDAT